MRYLAVSQRWLDVYRIEASVLGLSHYQVLPEIPERWREIHRRALAGEIVATDEDCLERADGRSQWLRWEVCPWYQATAEIGGIVIFTEDITERKSERERIAKAKLAEQRINAQRLKLEESHRHQVARQTAAAIAHELNQPLTAMVLYNTGALQLLRTGVLDRELLQHALENSEQQAQRASQVIHELMSQLYKDEDATQPSDIEIIVEDSISILADNGELDGITVARQIPTGLPPVLINRLQIKKVMVNLMRNSLQAIQALESPNREISLMAEPIPGNEAMLRFTIRDTGKGIGELDLHSIFQPFYSTKTAGLGMGLAISRSLVESHGGTLWAEANAGPGASFHFTLPFAE